jgi:ribokinase
MMMNSPAAPRVIVIGSANVDLCMNLPLLPTPGETLGGGKFRQTFGGKGANSAVAAAQAGGNVALIGCVGRDANGAEMMANLRAKNVETTFVEEHPSAPTGVAFIFIDDHAQNMIGVAAGANDEVTPERIDALQAVLQQADVLVIQNEVPEKTVEHLLELAGTKGWRVLYNCAPARKISPRLLALVEWLVVNESEAALLSGQPVSSESEAGIAAQALLGHGVKNVLITLGAEGVCVAQNGGSIFHVPAFPVKALDTVGAGDTFCGVLAVACGEGRELAQAVRFAAAAAAISVTRAGAQNAAPRREEIEHLLSQERA